MGGASRSVSRSCRTAGQYFGRLVQGRVDLSASHVLRGRDLPSRNTSPGDRDRESKGLVSARKECFGLTFVASSSEDVTCRKLHMATRHMSSMSLLLQQGEKFRQYGAMAFVYLRCIEPGWSSRGSLLPSPASNPFITGGIRWKTKYSKSEQAAKRAAKKKKAKQIRVKLRQIRLAKKLRKASMTPEQTFLWRIEKCKKKIALHEEQLKKFELPPLPEPDPDPEVLTPEQLYALKKLGYKNKNYVPVGRRGIYGGTIQNMHMHWKKHETVRIDCDNFPKEKIKEMGETLERLSGGIVIDIHQGTTIIMWRGRNYKRPKVDIPIIFKNFNKRKALIKSKHEQSIGSLKDQIVKWEKDLRELRADMAREEAARARWLEENPGMAPPEPPAPVSVEQSDDDSDEVTDISDDDITEVDDLGPEYDDDSDWEYPDSDVDLPDRSVPSNDNASTSNVSDSNDEWESNLYGSGDETGSDTDTSTREIIGRSYAIRRKP
ncbi:uncharacterized protein [Physcomitrium patens]|uniref:CRM domain-containing protein n=1 Tax=Physcomitrium patens TaxID=3218 RepID=A0A2K1KWI3_PHYPA|nr:uncharacterized CRM domain-containing protein At3g25440, chloroplastic-like [Physcomitrium patens]PNR58128.1 hypothetical protein PHYPA_005123 [Physcomitrium patens]|eukprot:XP_024369529.1 uncharacterized CRM domain-containing protein At3g25440, chloroplastic-like [Physcomitrella patens]